MTAWISHQAIGGFGGSPFEIFGGNGKFVRTITVYANTVNLFGLYVTWTDATNTPIIGRATESSRTITFSAGETVTRASLWPSKDGTRTGGISLFTSKGQSLRHGGSDAGVKIFHADVGSGYLGGFAGRHGLQLGSLAFTFLRPNSSVEIVRVQYANLPGKSTIIPTTSAQSTQVNNTNTNIEWNAGGTVAKTDTTVWETLAFHRFGGKVRAKAGTPVIVSKDNQFHWEVRAETSWEQRTSSQIQHSWDNKGTLRPRQKILATSTIQVGDATVPFSSSVEIRVQNTAVLRYPENGKLSITQHKFAKATAVEITGLTDFHPVEPIPNDDGKVPIEPEKARKEGDGNLVATNNLEA